MVGNSYVVCIKTIVMVEAKIEINSHFILKWLEDYLIKCYFLIRKMGFETLERGREELQFFIEFEYTRTNIVQHLYDKASRFFGYDPDENERRKNKIKRRINSKKNKIRSKLRRPKQKSKVNKVEFSTKFIKKTNKVKNSYYPKIE